MEPKDIARINELARKQKSQGLTEDERAEQLALRQQYLASIRRNLQQQLDSTVLVEPDGTRHHLRPKENKD